VERESSFLAQGRAEVEDTADASEVNQNLYLRRFRVLAGGNITDRLSFFFETDTPNLGKYDVETDAKTGGDIFLQDLIVTYSFSEDFKIDGGLILIPVSHNSEQSAASLLPVDYGAYSFISSGPTQSRVGRDYGVQMRGYPFQKRLEYRLGIYQGIRNLDTQENNADAPFRYTGRIVLHLSEPQTGFFYSGTSLGKKKILDIGASADLQDTYRAYAGDLFYDQPLPNGDGITFQLDYIYYDGDDTFIAIPSQNDWLIETGYFNQQTKLRIFAQVAFQDVVQSSRQDEKRYQAGLAYWGKGHNFNLKLGYTIIYKEHLYKMSHLYRDQYILQSQVFMF